MGRFLVGREHGTHKTFLFLCVPFGVPLPAHVLRCAALLLGVCLTLSGSAQSSSSLATETGAGQSSEGPAPTPPPFPDVRVHHLAAEKHSAVGFETHIGLSGPGGTIGVPLGTHFAVRAGGDMVRYTGVFQEDAATINAYLRLGYAKAQVDWFPRGGHFHISPLVVAANNTRVGADVVIDPSQRFDLDGHTFQSSTTDPLHGSARVDTRHVAPGLTMGFGNVTRGRGHFSFPAELGFFYVGQPRLQVNFSGTACDPSETVAVACMRVQDNAEFVRSLNAFIARNSHNLTYARFMPILSFGMGYRFGHVPH